MEHDFRFYAKGTAFEDEVYDLRRMELLISSYRSITDRLIAVQLGRKQLSPSIKSQIDYDLKIRSGSIEFLIDFIFTHKELISAIGTIDGGHHLSNIITKLLSEAITLRKEVALAIKNGFPINITINNNINIGKNNVIANSNNGNITINDPKILWAAQVTKYPVDRLISSVDGKEIEYVDFGAREEKIHITTAERVVLGQNKEELSAVIDIIGRLDMVTFSTHKGIVISENEKFPVIWDESIRNKVQRVADIENIRFTVRPIIDHKRLHLDAIAYHVIDCEIPQQDLKL